MSAIINGNTVYCNGAGGGGGNSQINYSTEEQVVGTWIDGRPLYQKTYNMNCTADDFNEDLTNLDIATCVELKPYAWDGNQYYFDTRVKWDSSSKQLVFSNGYIYYSHLTIQYTKTTDTV